MSRTGISTNTHQPDRKCLNCKYWKPARVEGFGIMAWHIDGRCTAGYCKKYIINKRGNKK